MATQLERFLARWPKPYLTDQDLGVVLDQPAKRHDAVKYAVANKTLLRCRRGLYLINDTRQSEPFEVANLLYSPSYISLSSALAYHQWIPEAVYTTTSVSTRRSKSFQDTPLGPFTYAHTPIDCFYHQVARIENDNAVFLIAKPWKAIADYCYVYKREWGSLLDLQKDMRIEDESLATATLNDLQEIIRLYNSKRVQKQMHIFLKALTK